MWWKLVAAAVLAAVALDLVPIQQGKVPDSQPAPVEPSADLKAAVEEVRHQLRRYSAKERGLWSELWSKVATVARDPKTVFNDTPTLRAYQIEMLTIGWIILGDHSPGANPALDVAVTTAFNTVLSADERAVDDEVKRQYADMCDAMAWAGR